MSSSTIQQEDPVEDLIYLLSAILDQAKELTLGNTSNAPIGAYVGPTGRTRRRTSAKKNACGNLGKNVDSGNKLKTNFDASVVLLVDSVRRDVDTSNADLSDDSVLVRQVLNWLYRGLDEDRRHLAPVLRPYLNRLFTASHENGWHLEEWRRRQDDEKEEMRVLGSFCRMVTASEASASEALLDAVTKGWIWAENMLDVAEYLVCSDITGQPEVGLQLVFTPADGKVIRQNITLPSAFDEHFQPPESRYSTFSSTKSTYNRKSATGTLKMKKSTLLRGASVMLPALLAHQQNNWTAQGKKLAGI
jgi:hypothetical protein